MENKENNLNKENHTKADEMLYRTVLIHWLMDPKDETNVRPFVYLNNEKSVVGYLDDLSKSKAPGKDALIINNEMMTEYVSRMTPSTLARNEITLVTEDFLCEKVSREQILGLQEFCRKVSRKFINDTKKQQELFSIENADKRRNMLSKISINSQDIKWHIQEDDKFYIRPMLVVGNKAGYLDNAEMAEVPNKESLVSSYELSSLIASFYSFSNKHKKQIDMILDELSLPCGLTQKRLALISEVYHNYANDYANEMMNLDEVFVKSQEA